MITSSALGPSPGWPGPGGRTRRSPRRRAPAGQPGPGRYHRHAASPWPSAGRGRRRARPGRRTQVQHDVLGQRRHPVGRGAAAASSSTGSPLGSCAWVVTGVPVLAVMRRAGPPPLTARARAITAGRVVAGRPWSSSPASWPVRWSSLAPGRWHEPVTNVADGANQRLVLGAELGAQPPDVHINRAGAAEVVIAPDLLEQLGPGEDPGRVLGQELQQLEFLERQVERAAAQAGRVGRLIDRQVAGPDLVRRVGGGDSRARRPIASRSRASTSPGRRCAASHHRRPSRP